MLQFQQLGTDTLYFLYLYFISSCSVFMDIFSFPLDFYASKP